MTAEPQKDLAKQFKSTQPKNLMQRAWTYLVEPPAVYTETDLRVRAKLLATLQVLHIPLIIFIGMIIMPYVSGAPRLIESVTFIPASVALTATLFTYWLYRRGHFYLAAGLFIFIIFYVAPFYAISVDSSHFGVYISSLVIGGVIVASILYAHPIATLIASALVIIGTLSIPLFTPVIDMSDILAMLSINIANSILITYYVYQRNSAEQQRQAHLQSINQQLVESHDSILEGWSRALELKDPYTNGHALRTADLSVKMAMAIGLKGQTLVDVYRGALVHDIGKIGIPDQILLKDGPLTEQEMDIVRKHPTWGRNMLEPIPFLQPAMLITFSHHEKWDGSGYPQGLAGADIPLIARLFCLADVYDALTSDRPYRDAWNPDDVDQYIQDQSGLHFDPECVRVFFEVR